MNSIERFRKDLIGDRIILKFPSKKYIDNVLKYANDKDVARYNFVPYPIDRDYIENVISDVQENLGQKYLFWVFEKSIKEVIGGIGLENVKDNSGEVGYWLGKKFWHKGYMREAMSILILFSYQIGLEKIYARVDERNGRSIKFLKRFGYERKEEPVRP